MFVALPTPVEIRASMAGLIGTLSRPGADVRWESREKLHCTLKFLGPTSREQQERLGRDLAAIARGTPALTITYRTLGCFPTLRDPRVIWVGMTDATGALSLLQTRIEAAAAGVGFPPEDRPFHPHVTLGRVRGRTGIRNLITTLESSTFESTAVTIAEFHLVKSDLRPGGSVYTTMGTFPLSGPQG
jgi:RNA 2',3'-cyclic 3'-phosphodiesterase